jgi:hypothetical protein
MASIYDWSKTPASNSSADAAINWAEGMDPAAVNDSARQEMARIAEFRDDITGTITAGGSANALTVTANSGFTTLANGRMVAFIAAIDNTGAATLAVNGLAAKSIRKMDTTSGDVPLTGGEIQAGGVYVALYNAAMNGLAGGWMLVNPTFNAMAGPSSAADNAITRFDGTSGKLVQNSSATISDTGDLAAAKGTFSGQLIGGGTITNDDAASGKIGEVQTADLTFGSAQALASGLSYEIVQMLLGAGDWELTGFLAFSTSPSTSVTRVLASISETSATIDSSIDTRVSNSFAAVVPGTDSHAFHVVVGPVRKKIANGSTVAFHLVALANFSVDALAAWGRLYARRMR